MQNLEEMRETILKYGHRHKIKHLDDFCSKLDADQVAALIDTNFLDDRFKQLLMFLLNSIQSEWASNQIRRLLIVNTVIKNLEGVEMSNSECNAIIAIISGEITKLSEHNQMQLLKHFLYSIQKQSDSYPCFKDFIPLLLVEMPKKNRWIQFNDQKLQENEFKTTIIQEICSSNWKPEQITAIASMFYDIPMGKEDHLIVLKKFGQMLRSVKCQQLPSLFHQLLLFCNEQHFRYVFFYLEQYFNYFKYREVENSVVDSSNDPQRFDEKFQKELNQVEISLLMYIYEEAKSYYLSFKDYLNTMKNFSKIPELIFSPFQLRALLAISCAEPTNYCVSHEILRAALVRLLTEKSKSNKSIWFSNNLHIDSNHIYDIDSLFLKIVNNHSNESELIIQGLLNFSLMLLDLRQNLAFGQDLLIDKQYTLAITLISLILKKKQTLSSEILKHLLNKVSCKTPQIINCIRVLCRKNVLIMLEHKDILIETIQKIIIKDYDLTYSLIQAIMPVAEICQAIRDMSILVIRKLMISRQFSTKEISLISILKLLKSIKTKNLVQLSQQSTSCSSSSLTSMSQLSNQFDCCSKFSLSQQNNENVVLEILKILNQYFLQHSGVRLKLYQGLSYVAHLNEELAILVLGMFWTHFGYFLDADFSICFQKTIISNEEKHVIDFEPLGKLMVTVSTILKLVQSNHTKQKFEKSFDAIEKQLLKFDKKVFESIDFGSSDDDNKRKIITLIQYITMLEALIAHRLLKWFQQIDEDNVDSVYTKDEFLLLLDKFNSFSTTFQNKLMKKKDKKSTKANITSNDTDNDTSTKELKNLYNLSKTIIEFSVIERIIQEIFGNRDNVISNKKKSLLQFLKQNQDFNQFLLNITLETLHGQKSISNKRKENCIYVINIAAIFYQYSTENFSSLLETDFKCLLMIVECFHVCLTIIVQHYRKRFHQALMKICANEIIESLDFLIKIMIEKFQKLFNDLVSDKNVDADSKKLPLVLLNIIRLLADQIINDQMFFSEIFKWLDGYAEVNKCENKALVTTLVQFWFEMAIRHTNNGQFLQTIALNLASQLGTINKKEMEPAKKYAIISDDTVVIVLQELCDIIKTLLNDILWLISRFNMEYSVVSMSYYDTERVRDCLTRKEQDLCTQLLHLIHVLRILTNLGSKNVTHCGMVFKPVSTLFTILRMLTNYFMIQSTKDDLVFQNVKFDKVIRLVGKQLTNNVFNFVQFIDNVQHADNGKGAKSSKSLRDTLSIPKTLSLIEQFNKCVLKLSSKTKVDLSKDICHGNYHGYQKLKVPELGDGDTTTSTAGTSTDRNSVIEHEDDDSRSSDIGNHLDVIDEEEVTMEMTSFADDHRLTTIVECSDENFDFNDKENCANWPNRYKRLKIDE